MTSYNDQKDTVTIDDAIRLERDSAEVKCPDTSVADDADHQTTRLAIWVDSFGCMPIESCQVMELPNDELLDELSCEEAEYVWANHGVKFIPLKQFLLPRSGKNASAER